MQRGKRPYQRLGQRLSEIRKKLQETLPEVSGAVELESDIIAAYERGEARPSEDVLELLIAHFEISNEEADELWDLAGYGSGQAPDQAAQLPTMVMVPFDNRIIYTDTANVTVNNYGVVMSFMQTGPGNQPVAVSRVGMSMEHAKSILQVLEKTFAQAEAAVQPKQLPSETKAPRGKK